MKYIQTSQIFYYEEEEAGKRDPNKDLELHQSVCEELCCTMNRIKELKPDQSVSFNILYFDVLVSKL